MHPRKWAVLPYPMTINLEQPPIEPDPDADVPPVVRVERGLLVAFAILISLVAAFAIVGGFYWQKIQRPAGPADARLSIDLSRIGIAPAGPSLVDYRRFDARMQQLIQQKSMVGAAVVIVEKGEINFAKGYGVIRSGSDEPVTNHTVFRWASVSKGVASTLLAKLAEQKKLSLSDPVARWAPSMRLPNGNERVATIEDVLSHRLGIVKNAYDGDLEGGESPKSIRSRLFTLFPMCRPGQCFAYQNIAYDAASEAVENVTRESYEQAARSLLFAPLGMQSASTTMAGLQASPSWARPHEGTREIRLSDAYYRVPAAGGVNSSIIDLGLWMRAQLGKSPAVLSRKLLDQVHAPRIRTYPTHRQRELDRRLTSASYALGWRDFHYAGHRLIGHRGAVDGYRSLILFDPALNAGIALLWNSNSIQPVGAQLELFDMLYRQPYRDWMELDKARP